jgi:hypothetical protein
MVRATVTVVFVFVVVMMVTGCGKRDYIKRVSGVDVQNELFNTTIKDFSFQGTMIVTHGVIPEKRLTNFINRHGLVQNDHAVDYIHGKFDDYSGLRYEYYEATSPTNIYMVSRHSVTGNGRPFGSGYSIYLDVGNGSVWVIVSTD